MVLHGGLFLSAAPLYYLRTVCGHCCIFSLCVYILPPRRMACKMVLHVGSEDVVISIEFHHGGNSPSVHSLVALAG